MAKTPHVALVIQNPAPVQVNLNTLSASPAPINVAKGQPIVIQAMENPTTGYTWNWNLDGSNQCGPNAFTVKSSTYERSQPNMMGSGGVRTITVVPNMNAVSGTNCSFGFSNGRSWEMPSNWQAAPQRVVNVHIA